MKYVRTQRNPKLMRFTVAIQRYWETNAITVVSNRLYE